LRCGRIALFSASLALGAAAFPARAGTDEGLDEQAPRPAAREVSPAAAGLPAAPAVAAQAGELDRYDKAAERGLAYLARTQKDDGSWEVEHRNAVTALALLAFLAGGHTPTQNRYSDGCRKALLFLVDAVPDDGYVGRKDGSRMYGQGIVTLALAEALGMERDPEVRRKITDRLERAVRVILEAQKRKRDGKHAGGWRYEPTSDDSDLSLTGWCALALKASQNCGLDVPDSAVEAAADYVERNYHEGRKGFSYQRGRDPSLAMTGVGILALHLLGREDSARVKEAAATLARKRPEKGEKFFYYTLYYATQAANQLGGDVWEESWSRTSSLLHELQSDDGSWPESRKAKRAGRPYSTAMAVLALSVRYHYLPSYQR
jgi:hypothetical protein